VIIGIWQLRNDCTTALASACYRCATRSTRRWSPRRDGGCFGFLWWNAPPAKIWMGDTGSLALGGVLAGLAIITKTEMLLILLGGLFVIITMSVVIQVGVFKMTKFKTGKPYRVFRMAPLQHHFEQVGWAETTIVVRFWLIAGMFVALGLGIFYVGLSPVLVIAPAGEGGVDVRDQVRGRLDARRQPDQRFRRRLGGPPRPPLPGRLDAAEAGGGHHQRGRRDHRVRLRGGPGHLEREQRPKPPGICSRATADGASPG